MERRSPGHRAGLTAEQVRTAARELLTTGGSEALTMRALAARLGVSPNALYSHVVSKTALIDDVLDDVLADVRTSAVDADGPVANVFALLESTYRLLLTHAQLIPVLLARQGARGPNARRLGDVMLVQLARAGVGDDRAREALDVLIVYTIGFAAFASRAPLAEDSQSEVPLDTFRSGLRWLLAGIAGNVN